MKESKEMGTDTAEEVNGASIDVRPPVDLVDWILYPVFVLGFFLVLFFFEVIERIAFFLGGRLFLKRRVVPMLCRSLLATLKLVGAKISVPPMPKLDPSCPYIIVSNHQSMIDIPLIGWVFREVSPQYISKIELARGIPGISYSLRNSGDVLIDRSNSGQALKEILKLGKRINSENGAAVIFPEGTRARDGALKSFKSAGFSALVRSAPRAAVIAVTIDGSWKLSCYRKGPIPRGIDIKLSYEPPVSLADWSDSEELLERLHTKISNTISEMRET